MTQNPLERARENKIIAEQAVNDYFLRQYFKVIDQQVGTEAKSKIYPSSIIDRHTPPERELTRRFNAIGVQ